LWLFPNHSTHPEIMVRLKDGDEETNGNREDQAHPYHDDPEEADEIDGLLSPHSSGSLSVGMDGSDDVSHQSWKKRIEDHIPLRLKRASEAVATWVKGPQPPRIYTIEPLIPTIQHAPLKLLDRYAPKRIQRFWLLMALYACWIIAFVVVQHQSSFASEIEGYGPPDRLWCGARYWNDDNGCGINGDQCRPFSNSSLAFRCPADCLKTMVLKPHAVGAKEISYKPLIVGGPTNMSDAISSAIYRADSFICGAAVHAGFIDDRQGGCGVLQLIGQQERYTGTKAHGVESVEFDSYFPQSFTFKAGTQKQCRDLRWPTVVITLIFAILVSIFTTSPAVFFCSIFVALFFQTGLATDPPNLGDYRALISIASGRFLPAAFCGAAIYRYCVRTSLTGLTAQIEKTVLWLGPAFVGALNNYTFDRIPIQRLTPHDLKAQPGAIPALIIIVLSIFFIALGQAWSFRVEGRMPRYLVVYSIFVIGLLVLVAVPHMRVRIHHYILALLLLPGTAFQNRPSLLYQGLLVGLFVNGIARWGFDPLLQTEGDISSGYQLDSLLPIILPPVIGALNNNITFTLGPIANATYGGKHYDGISVLVNDVERLRSYPDWDDSSAWTNDQREWTWNRHHDGLSEYFRFAYMIGSSTGDYTKAGTWLANGSWVEMKSGPSKY